MGFGHRVYKKGDSRVPILRDMCREAGRATGETQWGPSVRASIAHQVRRVTMSASYGRAFVPTFSFGGLSGNQQVSAAVRAPLTTGGRLSVSGSTSFSREPDDSRFRPAPCATPAPLPVKAPAR